MPFGKRAACKDFPEAQVPAKQAPTIRAEKTCVAACYMAKSNQVSRTTGLVGRCSLRHLHIRYILLRKFRTVLYHCSRQRKCFGNPERPRPRTLYFLPPLSRQGVNDFKKRTAFGYFKKLPKPSGIYRGTILSTPDAQGASHSSSPRRTAVHKAFPSPTLPLNRPNPRYALYPKNR